MFGKQIFFQLPMLRSRKYGTYESLIKNNELIEEITKLPTYAPMTRGELIIEDGDYELASYVSARLVEHAPRSREMQLKDENGKETRKVSQRYKDMR